MRAGSDNVIECGRPQESLPALLKVTLLLALPVWLEQMLHAGVGITDTYIANHLVQTHAGMTAAQLAAAQQENTNAGAAVNTASYLLWFVGLLAGSIGMGSTAIIARATGARHRSLANSICGQSIGLGMIVGLLSAVLVYHFAPQIAHSTGLQGRAQELALLYVQRLAFALPFMIILFIANSCLRGAGDTTTPAAAMILVDALNILLCLALTRGWMGLPQMGFDGIATGTTIAYIAGGVMQLTVLIIGRGGIRLHLHRLRPHWHNMRRLLKIGLPTGLESAMMWIVNFVLIRVINEMDTSQVSGAAHGVAVRIEALSYLTGFALATASTTLVGQSLGMKDPRRAERCAYLAFGIGASAMAVAGLAFIFFGGWLAVQMADTPAVQELTRKCLFITGFIQAGFAAAMVFGGSLRGAGDTMSVMLINLCSLVLLRLCAVVIAVQWFKIDLPMIWLILSLELLIRGVLLAARFMHGGWKRIKV